MRRRNFLLVLLFSVFLYLALVFRLFYLQVFKGEYYKNLAKRNYIRRRVVYAQRGDILDRNGVKLAYDLPEYALFLDPQVIEEKSALEETLKNLDELFGIKLSYEFLQSKRRSVEPILLRKLEGQGELDKFYNNSYRLPGVFINMLPKRFYPFGEECAHFLGYVGYPTQDHMEKYRERISFQSLVGRQGLERVLDEKLLGWVGAEELIVNAVGKVIGTYKETAPKKGNSLVLTIDSRIQKITFEIFKASGHKAGAIIVLRADTGEVLALMSYPSYDPNLIYDRWEDYQKDPMNPLFNRALNAFYPPGSVIKVSLAIGLLQEGVNPKEGIFCRGKFSLGNRDFYCWLRSGHGWENIRTAIRDSCMFIFITFATTGLDQGRWRLSLGAFPLEKACPLNYQTHGV